MVRMDGVPPTPPASAAGVIRWTKLTVPISATGLGKSSRVCPPRLSLRLMAPRVVHRDTLSMEGRSVVRFHPGL